VQFVQLNTIYVFLHTQMFLHKHYFHFCVQFCMYTIHGFFCHCSYKKHRAACSVALHTHLCVWC
jgi:hypothetical protein